MKFIETQAALGALASGVAGERLLAIDTEAAGYHRYHDRICLVQLSTRTDTFVIDTLAVRDLAPLADVLAAGDTEIVLHDAEYDLRLLARDFGLGVSSLFDTKVAAQFLGEPAIGLAGLVEKHLGVRLDKKHQRADWARRPLAADMLRYAAEDTRHLPGLRDRLRAALEAAGRLGWAEEEFELRAEVRWEAGNGDADAWLRMKNTRDLKPRELAALRELYAWRESVASERDVATFRVLSNEAIVAIARALPESPADLAAIREVAAPVASRHGRALLEAVERVRAMPADALPTRPRAARRPPPDPDFDALVERLKAVRDEAADALGLDRGFLMPRQQLEDVARLRPGTADALRAVPDLRDWQVEAVGAAILEALRKA
jgi:ribonuclease D